MSLKLQIHKHCRELVAERLRAYQHALDELIASTANETKSTAGDKYETGRAMLHIEQDNIRRQMSEALAQKAVLDAIDPTQCRESAGPGSLIRTPDALYFLSTALGRMTVEGQPVIALSVQSPLGAAMTGRRSGEEFVFNGRKMLLEEIS